MTHTHVILLLQTGLGAHTRTYTDFESVDDCLEGILEIYKNHLICRNTNCSSITYNVQQLFEFLDQLADISCLIYSKCSDTYAPFSKEWIKEKLYVHLYNIAIFPDLNNPSK